MHCYLTSRIINTLAVFERKTNIVPLHHTVFPKLKSGPMALSCKPCLSQFAEISVNIVWLDIIAMPCKIGRYINIQNPK